MPASASSLGPPDTNRRTWSPWRLSDELVRELSAVPLDKRARLRGRVYEIKGWKSWPLEQRLSFMRKLANEWSRDPHLAELANQIIVEARVSPRDHRACWGALLQWVQKNIHYHNERDERFQSPQYTLSVRFGDCDDLAFLLGCLGGSLRLPWNFTVSGTRSGRAGVERHRWVHGQGHPPLGVEWSHIYLVVGGPPFRPTWWCSAEPTLPVPLGWDVIQASKAAGKAALPELAGILFSNGRSIVPMGIPAAYPERVSGLISGARAFGDTAANDQAPGTSVPARVGGWLKALPWLQIVAATLPTVLATVVLTKLGLAGPRTGRYRRNPRRRRAA